MAGHANRGARGCGGGVYASAPHTECLEMLCKHEFEKGHFVRVESEQRALAVCMGFAFGGARTFTAAFGGRLSYLADNARAAASARLPIVMMAGNGTLGMRDSGWMQFHFEDSQEVFDATLLAFRLAEDARVQLPAMVCRDTSVFSHTLMQAAIPDQEAVDAFLPQLDLPRVAPGHTQVDRQQLAEAMARVPAVYREAQDEFERAFGRRPPAAVVPYRLEDAEIALVSMGPTGATAREAVDRAREAGIKAGSLRVCLFRPFPADELETLLAGKRLAVLDRDFSPGMGGVLWSEIRSCVSADLVQGYVIGGDVRPKHLMQIIDRTLGLERSGAPEFVEVP